MSSERANKWLGALGSATQVDDPLAQTAVDQFEQSGKSAKAFAEVFTQFLGTVDTHYRQAEAALSQKESEFLNKEHQEVQQYYQDIVGFLGSAQPGPITEVAKEVLRAQPSLLTKLDIRMPTLNRSVLIHIGHILPDEETDP